MNDLISLIKKRLDWLEEEGLTRKPVDRSDLIDFSSNDYLGVARNTEVLVQIEDNCKAHQKSIGSTGSRLLTGHSSLISAFEKQVSGFHQAPAALLFNSGYDANLGLISSLGQKNVTIIYDELVHASIHDGIKLSKARSVSFSHNDLNDLVSKLTETAGVKIVAVESIYSMHGDEAPLKRIVEICEKQGATLIVDEAHATGLYGKKGQGRVVEQGLQDRVPIRLITFGKALGCHGAVVLSDSITRKFLVNSARSLIYTTALPDHSIIAIKTVYDMMSCGAFNNHYTSNLVNLFKESMKSVQGFDPAVSDSQIQAVSIPGNKTVLDVSFKLMELGFDVRPIRFPSVPRGSERLRISIHEFNTEKEISGLAIALKNILGNRL